jgi:hypothetical protein
MGVNRWAQALPCSAYSGHRVAFITGFLTFLTLIGQRPTANNQSFYAILFIPASC